MAACLGALRGISYSWAKLSRDNTVNGEAFNFGPYAENNYSVLELIQEMASSWPRVSWELREPEIAQFYESSLLKLNCDKAKHVLDWTAKLNFKTTTEMTAKWYRAYYENLSQLWKLLWIKLKTIQKIRP